MTYVNFNFPFKLGPKVVLRIIQECVLLSNFYGNTLSDFLNYNFSQWKPLNGHCLKNAAFHNVDSSTTVMLVVLIVAKPL